MSASGATLPGTCPQFAHRMILVSKCGRWNVRPMVITLVRRIADNYPEAQTIHLVLDNLSSHSRKALVERFGEGKGALLWDRFTVHYTPTHGSWLNRAEIE